MRNSTKIHGAFFALATLASAYYLNLSLVRCPDERADRLLRRTPEELSRLERERRKTLALEHETVELLSSDGLKLRGLLFPSSGRDFVVCVHGYRSFGLRDHASTVREYLKRGFSVLVPDGRAHGESEGRYIGFGWLDRNDLTEWCRYLAERRGCETILLHGVSMGAAAVICTAAEFTPGLESVIAGVVADSSFTSGYEEFRHVARNFLHIPEFPLLGMTSALAGLVCGYSLKKCSPLEAISRIRAPVLLIHGGADDFVPTSMSRRLRDACASECSLEIVPGASHAAASAVDSERYWSAVDAFIERAVKKRL